MSARLNVKTAEVFEPLLAPSRYKGAHGGRGSGKSHFFAELAVELAYRIPGFRIVCVREVQRSLKESVKRLIEDKIQALGLGAHFQIREDRIVSRGDGIILFQGMQDHTAESIKSLEGFDVAYVEEAQTISARSLEYLRPTIRKQGSEIWFSWNPRNASDPIDGFLRGSAVPENAVVVKTSWRDNPWFPDALEIERKHDFKHAKDRYAHIWEGEYAPSVEGSYYAREIGEIWAQDRVLDLPILRNVPVDTAWDIGVGDSTAIWLFQVVWPWVHFIDYYEAQGYGADHYAKVLKDLAAEREFSYGSHFLPHDVKVKEWGSGLTRIESLMKLGIRPKRVTIGYIDDGINACRQLLPRAKFDRERCVETRYLGHSGFDCLVEYHRQYDEKAEIFLPKPVERHWSRHGADGFRTFAMGFKEQRPDDFPDRIDKPWTFNDALAAHENAQMRDSLGPRI